MSTYDARDLPRLALLLALVAVAGCDGPAPHASEAQEEPPVTILEEVPRLDVEAPVDRDLAGDEIHPYELSLEAGDYVQIAAEQQGVDVALRLRSPAGDEVAHTDRLIGRAGQERLRALIETPGTYRLEVKSLDGAPHTGRYRLRIEARRPASEDDRPRVAAARSFHQGEELMGQGKPAEALPHYQQALDGWTATGETGERATTLYRLGVIAFSLQEAADQAPAFGYFEEARQIFEQEGNELELASLLTYLAPLQRDLGRLDDALDSFRHSAETLARIDDVAGEATALHGLAGVYGRLDRIEEAMLSYERAIELWQQVEAPTEAAASHDGLGQLFLDRGELESARFHYERALELAMQAGLRAQELRCRSRLAEILRREGRNQEARESLEELLGNLDGMEPQDRIYLFLSLGDLALQTAALPQARSHLDQALTLAREQQRQSYEAVALQKLGRAAYEEGQLEEARDLHRSAGEIHDRQKDRQGVVSARYGEARALYHLGDLETAETLLAGILSSGEGLRAESDSLGLRASYLAYRHHYWDLYVQVLMTLHARHPDRRFELRALEISERARARSLRDLLHETRIRSNADPQLVAEERRLQQRLGTLETQRHQALRPGAGGATEVVLEEIEKQRRILRLELERVRRKIRASTSPDEDRKERPLPSLAEIRHQVLDPSAALLVYHLGEEQSFAWRVDDQGITAGESLPGRREIEDAADRFLQALRDVGPHSSQEREKTGRELTQMLLPGGLLSGEQLRLVVVPDGRLHVVPFAALPWPATGELLLDLREVIQVPSAAVLMELRRRGHASREVDNRVVVLADPIYSGGDERLKDATPHQAPAPEILGPVQLRSVGLERLERLPFSGEEARTIGRHCEHSGSEALLLTGFEATKDRLASEEVRRARVLHFATHGIVDPKAPERSALLLSMVGPDGHDLPGLLPLDEIYDLDLAADLVVLSACRTGLGREVQGEGVIGLARGFFYAGAPRVIHTLWSVDDESTSELMGLFYQHYLTGKTTPSQALRRAQRELRARPERSAPFYWAAFVFQGDWWAATMNDDPIGGTLLGPVKPPEDPPDDDVPIKLPPSPPADKVPGGGS